MGVPDQVDIESGHDGMVFVFGHNLEEYAIFVDKVANGGSEIRRIDQTDVIHLFHKGPLSYDCPDQVEGEGG